MNRRKWIGALGIATTLHAAPTAREQFIGVWKLIRSEDKFKDGRIEYPYGQKPVGRLTYDQAGRMSGTIMKSDRRSTMPPGVGLIAGKATAEEIHEAVNGFVAYFGTFDVDEPTKSVIHHVQASLVPSWVGKDLKRTYQFNGNRLVLTAVSTVVRELVWEREP